MQAKHRRWSPCFERTMWLSGSHLGKLPWDSGGHDDGNDDQDDDRDDVEILVRVALTEA